MKKVTTGAEFLNLVFKDLKDKIHSSTNNPSKKISEYLERLEKIHGTALSDEHKMEILKSFYYDKYIIKTLPESYIKYKKGYIKELGLDRKKELTDEDKNKVLECIRREQKISLDNWMNYLFKEDNNYPTWFKYYIFQGITKVGGFYPVIKEFTKRSSSTTEPFLPVKKDVINNMYLLVSKYLDNETLTEEEQRITSTGLNFRNLYSNLYRPTIEDYSSRELNTNFIEQEEYSDDVKSLFKEDSSSKSKKI